MQVIKATIEKLQSSSMIKNYAGLMDELSDTFQTNLSKEDIGYLVQSTLDDGQWKVLTYSVSGSDSQKVCYSLGTDAYVMIPNKEILITEMNLSRRFLMVKMLSRKRLMSIL